MEKLFVTGTPVVGEQLIGRGKELKAIIHLLQTGQSIILIAPRRFGKTSLLLTALTRLKGEGNYVADVDLFGVVNKRKLAERITSSSMKNKLYSFENGNGINVTRSINSLLKKGIIRKKGESDYVIIDPFFEEYVQKVEGQAEALRFYNYPYRAVEEALTNAVYHKDYENRATIEVNIRSDRIEILSFPDPLPPIDNTALKQKIIVARDYRNRRIGDFLKELHLAEGRSTGIPTIYKVMQQNQSPEPLFETNVNRNYFLTTLPINQKAAEITKAKQQNVPLNVPLSERMKLLLELVNADKFITVEELAAKCAVSDKTIKRDIDFLKNNNIIKRIGGKKTGHWEIIHQSEKQ